MASAGTAYIDFQARFDDLLRDVQRIGRRASSDLLAGFNGDRIGRDVGNDVGRGLGTGLGDLRRAGARAGDRFGDGFQDAADRSIKGMAGKVASGMAAAFAGAQVFSLLGTALEEAREAASVGRLTEAVIESTGKAANLAADEVGALAEELSKKAGIDDEVIQSGANLLLTFTKVRDEVGEGNDIFSQATELALDMSVAMGTDMKGAAMQLGKALNDPIKGMSTLGRAGVQFSEDQKEQIKTMVEAGDILGAQKMILGELETQFGGAAAAATDPIQKLSVMWGNFLEGVGAKILPWVESIADGFGERLPGMIGRGGAAIGEVRDRVVDFGRDLWERVEPAVMDLWSALKNLGEAGVDLYETLKPVGELMLVVWGAAVLGQLTAVAQTLEWVTGFLADHTDIVVAAAAAYGAWRVALIGQAVWAGMAGGVAVLSGAFDKLAISAYTALGAVSTSTAVASGLAGAAAGAVLAYTALQRSTENAREANDDFLDSIDFDADSLSINDLNDDVQAMVARIRELNDEANRSNWVQIGQDLSPFNENTITEAQKGQEQLDALIAETTDRILLMADAANQAGVSGDVFDRWAEKLNLDPATMSANEMADAIGRARRLADEGTPATENLAAAYTVLGDETSSATDELSAWKDVMDSIMGVHISYEQAQIGWAETIGEFTNAAANARREGEAWSTNIFGGDTASLETRSMIADLADEAINLAVSFGEAGGKVEGATWKLAESREQIIAAGEASGIAREDMEAYLDTLGLTPENIATNLDLTGEEAVEAALDHTTRDRFTDITPRGIGLDGVDSALNGIARDRDVPVRPRGVGLDGVDAALNGIARDRTVNIDVYYREHGYIPRGLTPSGDRALGNRWGGLYEFASGGVTPAHVALGTRYKWAEPETGGEAFIPRLGEYERSMDILGKAASWYDAKVVPEHMFQSMRGASTVPTPALAAAGPTDGGTSASGPGQVVFQTAAASWSDVGPEAYYELRRAGYLS